MTEQQEPRQTLRATVLELLCVLAMHGLFGLLGWAIFGHWLGFVGTVALTVAIAEVDVYRRRPRDIAARKRS